MAVRVFDGVDDFITCAIGGLSTQTGGPITIAAIIKKNANGSFQAFIALNTTAAAQLIATGVQGSNLGYTFTGGSDDANGAATPTYVIADGWVIYAMTKASGAVAPRFHKCVLSTGVWTHTSSAETNSDGAAPGASGQVMFGAKNNIGDFFNGRMALAGIYPTAKSDPQLEAMSATLQSWIDAGPTGLWPLTQADVGDGVTDIVGTSNQSAIVGTTVATGDDPPNFDFSLTPPDPGVVPLVVESPRLL